jgi:hypothetical protein
VRAIVSVDMVSRYGTYSYISVKTVHFIYGIRYFMVLKVKVKQSRL